VQHANPAPDLLSIYEAGALLSFGWLYQTVSFGPSALEPTWPARGTSMECAMLEPYEQGLNLRVAKMCIDQTNWRFCPYRKHETPSKYRSNPLADIDRLTLNSDSLYYPTHQPQVLEQLVIGAGIYVQSPKAHKTFKIHEFAEPIGACDGQPSRWVKVEVTSGEFHGRPISHEQYTRFANRQIPCCR